MTGAQQSYELLRPAELDARIEQAAVAYVPVGPLEFHGPHLPLGVDLLIADGLCRRTAARTGGVVLPPLYASAGVLPLQYSVNYELETLRAMVRPLLDQLAAAGFRVVVLYSGHGALDHLHVLRTECDALTARHPDVTALATVWNELTVGVDGDIHDHGAKVETSYMLELWPETVDLNELSPDPAADHVGVYAANPRFTASKEWGETLAHHAVDRLSSMVEAMLDGAPADNWSDLRALVGRLQSGDLEVVADSGRADEAGVVIDLFNPHPQSKYVTAVTHASWDAGPVDPADIRFLNRSVGERPTSRTAGDLSPLDGQYVRTKQRLEVSLRGVDARAGRHSIEMQLELAGVLTIAARGGVVVADEGAL